MHHLSTPFLTDERHPPNQPTGARIARTGLTIAMICSVGWSSQARADVAFALQPAIGVGTAVQPLDTTTATTASSGLPRESFVMIPSLRLGIDLESVAILAYGSNSNAGVQGHAVAGMTRLGVLVEPLLWHRTTVESGCTWSAVVASSRWPGPRWHSMR